MATRENFEEYRDHELEEMIMKLRPVEARDPGMVLNGRASFEAELDRQYANPASSWLAGLVGFLSRRKQPKETNSMYGISPRFVFSSLIAVIAVLALLFGSASATVYAAQSALPGDALYTLKTGLEQTQVNLSRDAADRAQLHLDFAERRLGETAALIQEGRFNDISAATTELEFHIQQAIGELQAVALGDPARAEELAGDIASALTRYASTLSGMLAKVPENVRPDMARAIQASQFPGTSSSMDDSQDEIEFSGAVEEIAPDAWLVAGQVVAIDAETEIEGDIQVGDIVKVHATQNDDGSLIAREIELVEDGDDNENENENDNGNENDNDDNGNENENENDNDDNGNENDNDDNGNENENDNDDDGNENENDNDDDDMNDNDDNGNENENDNDDDDDNENDNDDNENDNDNDDDDDNENDNDNDNENENG